ncbi:DISARM system phospholipase D-like protein DrmC [Ramlibacter sp. MAHUQ-53]|uniref:DISARM system phospholipase D-like protein DrmC n=1 Tax=unclassified Ramlibacter TaxID=2617605 RepID=UPI00362F6101
MKELLDAVVSVASLISPEKAQALASRIRSTQPGKADVALAGLVGTPTATALVDQMLAAWQASAVGSEELASMLLGASHALATMANRESNELVWTGPTTPFVSARRTEQALLEVINAAQETLFITSFVAYDVQSIVAALTAAAHRRVEVSVLLELAQGHGGVLSFDSLGKMQAALPFAKLYAWRDKGPEFVEGRVHAKVAVADGRKCFITSANLTGYAMERNIEVGVLLSGGRIPAQLNDHLQALVQTRVITPV